MVVCGVLDLFCCALPLGLSFLTGRQGWGQGEVSRVDLHHSQHSRLPLYPPDPVAVPLDVPEDALPLPPRHLHLPQLRHPVPEAGLAPHPPDGEVTGGGGEYVISESVHLGCKCLRVLRLAVSNIWGADGTFFSCQVQLLPFT